MHQTNLQNIKYIRRLMSCAVAPDDIAMALKQNATFEGFREQMKLHLALPLPPLRDTGFAELNSARQVLGLAVFPPPLSEVL